MSRRKNGCLIEYLGIPVIVDKRVPPGKTIVVGIDHEGKPILHSITFAGPGNNEEEGKEVIEPEVTREG